MRTGQWQRWHRDRPSHGEEMKNDERSRVRASETRTEKITSEHERLSGTKRTSMNPGTPCAWAAGGKWKTVHADLVASWSESKEKRIWDQDTTAGRKMSSWHAKQGPQKRFGAVLTHKQQNENCSRWKMTRENHLAWIEKLSAESTQDNEPDKRNQI
jgi:hypothetical protein